MNVLDWIIIVWLFVAFVTGARLGLVYRIGHVIGFVIGLWLAIRYQETIVGWFGDGFGWRIGSFITILVGVAEAAGLVALLVDKVFRIFSWIPFAKTTNTLLGGAAGVLGHGLIMSVALYFSNQFIQAEMFSQTIQESTLGGLLVSIGSWVSLFIPNF